jgi:uroporphyrinogen decarboxylase
MNSRERVLTALCHKEPDQIPFDLGGLLQSGVHLVAYRNLRRHLGLPEVDAKTQTLVTQTARLDEDFLERLRVDTRFVDRYLTVGQQVGFREVGDYIEFTDELGCGRRMPRQGGLYFDICRHPFDVDDVERRLENHVWPDPTHPGRLEGLKQEAQAARAKGKLVVLGAHCAGVFEVAWFLRGLERFLTDLASGSRKAECFLDKALELKTAYWEVALAELGAYVDVVNEADDVAGQQGLLMSPRMYRRFIKPRHRELFARIKQAAPHVKLVFHSCGAIRPLIPDLIEIGVDALNPVQISAKGMDPFALKQEFGQEICFWGGGVDTQEVLCKGTPDQVNEQTRRNIDALAPGGGFIFTPVHITQADVPPENFMAMWETLQKVGAYH